MITGRLLLKNRNVSLIAAAMRLSLAVGQGRSFRPVFADLAEPPPPRYPSAPMLVGNVNPCSRNSGAAASRRAAKKRKGKR